MFVCCVYVIVGNSCLMPCLYNDILCFKIFANTLLCFLYRKFKNKNFNISTQKHFMRARLTPIVIIFYELSYLEQKRKWVKIKFSKYFSKKKSLYRGENDVFQMLITSATHFLWNTVLHSFSGTPRKNHYFHKNCQFKKNFN